jgi:hypothetical protein
MAASKPSTGIAPGQTDAFFAGAASTRTVVCTKRDEIFQWLKKLNLRFAGCVSSQSLHSAL